MAIKHEPLLLSIFLSNRLNGTSPLTESSVSNSIKWCPSCASPLIILLEKFGEESVDTLQSPLRALPAARKGGVEEGNAISTGGWFCRNCGLHMLPFAPSMPVVSDLVASDKQMLLADSMELIDGGGVYKSWETEIMSSCGQLLDHIRQAVAVKVRLLDDQWKEMNKREARLRTLDRDLSGRVHGLAESEQRYQERLMKLNDYRDSLMRSIRIQLDDIRRREENLTRENFCLESTENHTMTIKSKPCNAPSPDRTPERKVELSSAQKTDPSFSQRRSNEGNFNRLKKEGVVQKLFPDSQNTFATAEKSTYDDFGIIGSSRSYKAAPDERLERSPKFQELLKNFQEHSPPVYNGFQRRFSQKAVTWNSESLELRARKESGNMGSYRDFELTNEDRKAIGTNEEHELRTREPLHKTNLIGNRSNAQSSFNSLSQSKAWLNSPQVKRAETREQVKQNTISSTVPADNMHGPVLVTCRFSKTSIQNDLHKRCSSTPRSQNSTEQQRISNFSTTSHPHAAPETNCLAFSNSLEAPAFQNKPNISHLESHRRSKQITKTDFAAANNFDQQSISRAAQASHRSDQQTSSNQSQTVDPNDRSKWEIRPRFRDDTSGSHNHRSRSHSPKAFLDRSRLLATLNNDFETRTQPLREATYRTSKSHRFAEP